MPPSPKAPCPGRVQLLSSASVYFLCVSAVSPCPSPGSCPVSTCVTVHRPNITLKQSPRCMFPQLRLRMITAAMSNIQSSLLLEHSLTHQAPGSSHYAHEPPGVPAITYSTVLKVHLTDLSSLPASSRAGRNLVPSVAPRLTTVAGK